MKMKPLKCKTEQLDVVLLVSARADKCGNVYYCVEYKHPHHGDCYVMFKELSSAMDFIQTNFK